MKAFWRYDCDFGHHWTFYRDLDAPERPEDTVCPFGHEAVTRTREPVVDRVEIAFRPGARVVDSVKGQIGHEYDFHLVLTDPRTGETRMSLRPVPWTEALRHAQALYDRGLTRDRSWAYFDKHLS